MSTWIALILLFLFLFRVLDSLFRELRENEAEARAQEEDDAAGGEAGEGDGDSPSANIRYLSCLMPLLAKLAKADGHVSPSEISRVERIFRDLELKGNEQRFAQRVFNSAKDDATSFAAYAQAFVRQHPHQLELRVLTFQFMVRVGAADGVLTAQIRTMLEQAARLFGIPDFAVRRICQQVLGYDAFAGSSGRDERWRQAPPRPSPSSREEDLALLGLTSGASQADVKKAYRQKAKELHPDRLHAQGLPEPMLKQASDRLAAINAAYERLVK